MNIPISLALSLAVALGANITRKYYTRKTSSAPFFVFLFNGISAVFSAIVFFVWGGFGQTSVYTLILGILFGTVVTVQNLLVMSAFHIGSMSYTNVIVSFSTLITHS